MFIVKTRALGNHSTLKAPEKSRSANGQKGENPISPQPDSTLLSHLSLISALELRFLVSTNPRRPDRDAVPVFFPRRTLVGGLHEPRFGETITMTAQGNSTSTMAKASKIHCIEK
jgi:hypothetical protein